MSALLIFGAGVAIAAPEGRHITAAEARPVLEELADILPLDLQTLPDSGADVQWSAWIDDRDSSIRARLAQGEEDTIVNWLLFGTSFTAQPRAIFDSAALSDSEAVNRMTKLIQTRADDLIGALQSPGTDRRRRDARRFLEGNGFAFTTPNGLADTRAHLLLAIQRVALEQAGLGQEVEEARRSGDPETELAVRSTLFRARGLSLDTSLDVNYGIEQALAAIKKEGRLQAGTVRRIAIIGGGLDVADRDAGLDVYPPQIVQPFALLDSVRKLLLSPAAAPPEVVVFDISPRVRDHITQARAAGGSYTLSLPLTTRKEWLPEFRAYWRTLGSSIGALPATGATPTLSGLADVRTLRIPAAIVRRVSAADLNIVTDRSGPPLFDLVVATNVLTYYDALEQELAASNIGSMLRPGGLLLSNTALPEMEAVPIELAGSITSSYARGQNSDQILWYRRLADPGR